MILGHTLFEQEFETNKDKKVKKSKSKIKIKKEMVANMTENTSNCSKSSLTSGWSLSTYTMLSVRKVLLASSYNFLIFICLQPDGHSKPNVHLTKKTFVRIFPNTLYLYWSIKTSALNYSLKLWITVIVKVQVLQKVWISYHGTPKAKALRHNLINWYYNKKNVWMFVRLWYFKFCLLTECIWLKYKRSMSSGCKVFRVVGK